MNPTILIVGAIAIFALMQSRSAVPGATGSGSQNAQTNSLLSQLLKALTGQKSSGGGGSSGGGSGGGGLFGGGSSSTGVFRDSPSSGAWDLSGNHSNLPPTIPAESPAPFTNGDYIGDVPGAPGPDPSALDFLWQTPGSADLNPIGPPPDLGGVSDLTDWNFSDLTPTALPPDDPSAGSDGFGGGGDSIDWSYFDGGGGGGGVDYSYDEFAAEY